MRISTLGFIFGFVGTFVATLGLAIRWVEVVAIPFLYPVRFVIQPFSDYFASLPGIFNILLFATLNGIFYAIVFALLAWIFRSLD
ncbi:MAG: hypothetical protein AAB407_02510 [Patescibacteria group bacterium]